MRNLHLASLAVVALLASGAGCSSRFDPGKLEPEPCEEIACTPANACHQGRVSCPSRACVDLGTPGNQGATCGAGKVCSGGTCVACTDATACQPGADGTDAACHVGKLKCSTASCESTAALATPGTSCGLDKVCSADGKCVACAAGQACASTDACGVATIACASGAPVCTRTGNALDGASCDPTDAQKMCRSGTCVTCQAGASCQPSANLCHAGTMNCLTGQCTDTGQNAANGTSCGTNKVCSGGACLVCLAGESCTPANKCHKGITSCATGSVTCMDTGESIGNGSSCGTDQVCYQGTCGACAAGSSCKPGADGTSQACHVGQLACSTGQPVCADTQALTTVGTSCGVNQVCDATGACVGCVAAEACSPANACKNGQRSCLSNPPGACIESSNKAAGASCGTNLVCDGAGNCGACTADSSCSFAIGTTNVCKTGKLSCASGPPGTCAPSGNVTAGAMCGTNKVCDGAGACVACTAGLACTPANACHAGLTSCTTGAQTCLDTGTNLSAGASCGSNQVCDGAGTCVACTAGAACTLPPGDPNVCKSGAIACGTGAPVCVAGTGNVTAGTACGTDKVCNGSGACVACVAGAACTPTNKCHVGTTSCSTGAQTCGDTGTSVAAGASCGTNQVCSPTGTCISCTAGQTCATNPGAACKSGVTNCSTGALACVDAANKSNGTSCGTNKVCKDGACSDCTAGTGCTLVAPANVCHTGLTSCTTGESVCTDSGNAVQNGTNCGTDQVCSGGSCVACTAGVTCSSPPDPCQLGATSCATGVSLCQNAGADAAKEGQTCGASATGTCHAGACACPANQAFYQGDCQVCPAVGTDRYVSAVTGDDNPCCGRLQGAGFAGPCKTVTYALGVSPTGGTIWVSPDSQGIVSSSETYPIKLERGIAVTGWGTVPRFPGSPGKSVFEVVSDGTQPSLSGLTVGPNGPTGIRINQGARLSAYRCISGVCAGVLSVIGTLSPGSVGVYVGPGATLNTDSGYRLQVSGQDVGVQVDGGTVLGNTYTWPTGSLYVRGSNTGVLCRSDSSSGAKSTITTSQTGNYFILDVATSVRDVVASTDCVIANANFNLGGSACSSPLKEDFGLYAESNASVSTIASYPYNTFRCARVDAISLRSNPLMPSNSPTVTIQGGTIEDNGCSGAYAEVGKLTLTNLTIRRNQWGLYQSSPLSSTSPSAALLTVTGGSLTCNRHTTAGACAASGNGSDVWNQSGLPLTATNVAWDAAPLAKCSCDYLLASCSCSGRAFGQTTPPDAIEVLTSPYSASTTGTPTVDTTGYSVSGSGCPTP